METLATLILAAADPSSPAFQMGYKIGYISGICLVLAVPILFIVSIVKYAKSRSSGWLAVMIITALPVLAFIGLFGYGVYTGVTQAQQHIADEQIEGTNRIVQVQESPLTLTMPDHWQMLNLSPGDDALQMGNLRSEEYLMAYSSPKSDYVVDALEFSQINTESLLMEMKGGKLVENASYSVNGLTVYESVVAGEIDGMKIIYKTYIIEGQDHFYQIMTWTLPSKKTKAFPVFDAMIQTTKEATEAS